MNTTSAKTSDGTGPRPGRVLAVDDDHGIRRLVTKVLRDLGYGVDTAESVDEALARLARDSYDVTLIDLNMPARSGLELIEAIVGGGIPVVPILLTGTTDVGAAVACMKRGAFDYLPKPIDPDALGWAVDRALRVARARGRETALEQVVSEWTATFDACSDGLLILDAAGSVIRANGAAGRAAGSAPECLLGRNVADLFPNGLGEGIRGLQCAPRAGREPVRGFDPARGAHFLASADPISTGAGPWIVVVRDVTQLVRGEEERKHLLRRVLSAQEDERRRIARELHDGIGQALVSLAVGLTALEAAPAADPGRLSRLKQVAAESLNEVRRLAHGLRPAVLDDIGLAAALGRLTEVFTQVHSVRAELILPDGTVPRLPTEIESSLYRIVQEGLTNVAKHARARTVDVVLEVVGGWVRVSLTDDGDGFSADGRYSGGMGLSGMRERAGLLGGTFQLESTPGRGTALDVRIPIPEGRPCPEHE